MKKIVSIFCSLFLFSACSTDLDRTNAYDLKTDPLDQAEVELSGVVTLEGEADHSNIEVLLRGPTKTDISTDASGAFVVNELTPGEYTISMNYRGFSVLSDVVDVSPGQVLDLGAFELAVSRAVVSGQLQAEDADVSLAGASITLDRIESARGDEVAGAPFVALTATAATFDNFAQQSFVGPDGTYIFRDVPVGLYNVVIQQENAGTVTIQVRVGVDGANVSVEPVSLASISGDFSIQGTLADSSKSAVLTAQRDVKITLISDGITQMQVGQTDSEDTCVYGAVERFATTKNVTLSAGDGTKTVCVQLLDAEGNVADELRSSIVLDTTAPDFSILRINGGNDYTTDSQAIIEVLGIDATSGMESIEVVRNGGAAAVYDYLPAISDPLTGQGQFDYEIVLIDRAGHRSATRNGTVIRDSIAPQGVTYTVGNGSAQVPAGPVTVTVGWTADGGSDLQMKLWLQSEGTASFVPITMASTIEIPAASGTYNIGLVVRDAAGNKVDIGPVAVTVDFTPPESPELALAGGAAYSTTSVVAISTLQAVDDSEVRVSESPTLSGASWTSSYPSQHSFSGSDGIKTLYAQFRDDAGNESEIVSAQIIVDTTAPEIAAFTLNSGAAYNTDPAGQFNVYLAAIDINGVTDMRLGSDTGSCAADGATEPYVTSKVHTYTNAGAGIEETAYVCVQVRDGAGNWSAAASASVMYDTQAPTLGVPSITVAGGVAATNETVISVALDATGADEMQLSLNSGFAGSGWLSYTTSTLFTLDSANGTKAVYVRFRDAAGNTVDDSDSVVLDLSGPGTPLVTLAGGNDTSTSRTVAVALSNSADAAEMLLSESAAFSGASWQAFNAATSYTFSSDGIATLYVMYRDTVGNESAAGSDSVVIDTGVPGAGQILIDSGVDYSTDTNLTLTLFSSGADQMRFAEAPNMAGASSWQAYSTSYAYTITTAGEGTKAVYAEFKDSAGNVSDVVSDDIIYDGTAPGAGTGIQIANDATYTTDALVTVTLDIPADATEMILADNTGFAGSSWQSTDTEVSWNLGSSDGTKTLYAKWRDAAGNETGLQSDSIELDTEPPAPGSNAIVINNGNAYSNATDTISVDFEAVGAVWMAVSSSQDFDNPEYYGAYGVSADIAVPATDGTYELFVVFADAAGNLSSVRSDSITLDRTAPELSDAILNDDGSWLQTQNARVQLFGYDENLLKRVLVSNGAATQSVPYVPSFVIDTGLAEGESGQFMVAIEDAAGNTSSWLTSQIVTRDSTPPTPGALPVVINGGAMYSNERFVDLEIAYGDATELRFSNNPGFTGSFWQDVTDYEAWNLSSGDGEKRVFVQFRDQAGNTTVSYADSITLDTQGPTNPQVLLGLNGLYTNQRVIDVDLVAQDSYSYEISTDIGFGTPVSGMMEADFAAAQITLPAADGYYTVYGEFEDAAGNRSALAQDTIILDRTRPEVYDLVLQSPDNYFAKDQWVRLQLDAWDDNPMTYALIDTTATFNGSASEETNVQGDIWYYVPVTGQEVTLYIKAYDVADNESSVTSTTIFVDVTAPTADIVVDGPTTVNTREIWLEFSNDSSDIVEYQINEFGDPGPNAWKVYDGYHSLALEDYEGEHIVFVWLRDWAGNESEMYQLSVTLDTQPPTLIGFNINESPITSATDWDVSVTGTTWSYAEVAEDPSFIDSDWFAGETTSYDVSHKADGRVELFARLCDDAGNCGNFLQAAVDLDTDAPYVDDIQGGFEILQGEWATVANVDLRMYADGAQEMAVAQGGSCGSSWAPYNPEVPFNLAGIDGDKTVSVQFRDGAGNTTSCYSRDITLDTVIDAGAIWDMTMVGADYGRSDKTAGVAVTVTLSDVDPDVVEMKVSNLPSFGDANWVPYAASTIWILPSGDGNKTVYTQIRDSAGNIGSDSASIVLDQTAPSAPALQILDLDSDGFSLSDDTVELSWSSPPGVDSYRLEVFAAGVSSDFVLLDEVGSGTLQYYAYVAHPGYKHYYRVGAYDDIGNFSGWSNVAIAAPYDPISEIFMVDEADYRAVFFSPTTGVFSLRPSFYYEDVAGNGFDDTLVLDSVSWLDYDYNTGNLNGTLGLRTLNQDSSLVFDSDFSLPSSQRGDLGSDSNWVLRMDMKLDRNGDIHVARGGFGRYPVYSARIGDQAGDVNLGSYSSTIRSQHDVSVLLPDGDPEQVQVFHAHGYYSGSVNSGVYLQAYSGSGDRFSYANWTTAMVVESSTDTFCCPSAAYADGTTYVAYYSESEQILLLATSSDGSSWVTEVVDGTTGAGVKPDIAIDPSDNSVHIAYVNRTGTDSLYHATNRYGGWKTAVIDSDVTNWDYNSQDSPGKAELRFSPEGVTSVAYYRANSSASWAARFAWYGNGTWHTEELESGSGAARNGIGLDYYSDSVTVVAYVRADTGELVSRTWNGSSWNTGLLAPSIDWDVALEIDNYDRMKSVYERLDTQQLQFLTIRGRVLPRKIRDVVTDDSVDLVVNSNDDVFLAWKEGSNGLAFGAYRYGQLVDVEMVTTTTDAGEEVMLEVDSTGTFHILHYNRTTNQLYYSFGTPGAWTTEQIPAPVNASDQFGFVLDANGIAHVVYTEGIASGNMQGTWPTYYHNRDGGSWSAPELIDTCTSCYWANTTRPMLTKDAQGRLYLVERNNSYIKDTPLAAWRTVSGTPGANDPLFYGSPHTNVAYLLDYALAGAQLYRFDPVVEKWPSYPGTLIDDQGSVGNNAGMVEDSRGALHISYTGWGTEQMYYTTNATGEWRTFTMDSTARYGETELAIDSDDKLYMLYSDANNPGLYIVEDFAGWIQASDVNQSSPF